MATTQDVLESHLSCFGIGDLDGIMADYAADTVLFTPHGNLTDHNDIRTFFSALLTEFGQPGTEFEMQISSVHGEYAYIVWSAETASNIYELGTDTFVVRNGKIVGQTLAAKITPKS